MLCWKNCWVSEQCLIRSLSILYVYINIFEKITNSCFKSYSLKLVCKSSLVVVLLLLCVPAFKIFTKPNDNNKFCRILDYGRSKVEQAVWNWMIAAAKYWCQDRKKIKRKFFFYFWEKKIIVGDQKREMRSKKWLSLD